MLFVTATLADEVTTGSPPIPPSALDPQVGRPFVVSAQFVMTRLPRDGVRTSILSKYLSARKGARGWGMFLRRSRTSLRPEIYWRGDAGGDFYTFERFQILPNRVYTLTLIAELNNYITLFIQSDSAVSAKLERPAPVFLGGYSVSDAGDLANLGGLLRGSDRQDDNRMIGSLQSFLIASPENVPRGREEKLKFVDGGPAALAAKFREGEIAIYEPPSVTAARDE